jgi:tRNA modification GTPase
VGKSSLLNYLLGRDRAIITDIPGTTRDIIEEGIYVEGVPIRLLDTAGLRAAHDLVEQIGVDRTKEALETADIIVFMVDAAAGVTEEDKQAFAAVEPYRARVMLAVNKIDASERELAAPFFPADMYRLSARTGAGVEALLAGVAQRAAGERRRDEQAILVNLRQQQALERCLEQVRRLLAGATALELDCLAVDLREALDALGEVSGKSLTEDIIDRIFRDFCIGK